MHPIQRGASGGVLEVGVGCGVRPAHAERCPGFSAGRILTRKGASPGLGGGLARPGSDAGAARKRLRRRDEQSAAPKRGARDQGVARGARRTLSFGGPALLPSLLRATRRTRGEPIAPRAPPRDSPEGKPGRRRHASGRSGRENDGARPSFALARISIASRPAPGHSRRGRKRHESHRRPVCPLPRDRRRSRRNSEIPGRRRLAEAAPERLDHGPGSGRRRRRAGPRLGRAAAEDADRRREGRDLQPAAHEVLQAGPVGARVRPARQSRPGLGRPGPGLRLAAERARHPHRPQGLRLARRRTASRTATS